MKAKIINYGNVGKGGLTLKFDRKVALNGKMFTDEWWVSWEKIGEQLLKQ